MVKPMSREMEDLLDLALRVNRTVVIPSPIIDPHKDELKKRGVHLRKVKVSVDDFLVSGYVITGKKSLDHILKIVQRVVGDFVFAESRLGSVGLTPVMVHSPKVGKAIVTLDDELVGTIGRTRAAKICAAYEKILRAFSFLIGGTEMRIVSGDNRDTAQARADDQNVITIFSNTAPPGGLGKFYGHYAFGISIAEDGRGVMRTYSCPGRGVIVKDENQSAVMQVIGSHWYALIPLASFFYTGSEEIFRKLLSATWKKVLPNLQKRSAQRSVSANAFTAVMHQRVDKRIMAYDQLCREHEEYIQRYELLLTEAYRVKRETEDTLALLRGSVNIQESRKRIPVDFEKIKKRKEIRRVFLTDEGFSVETNPLLVEHDGSFYAIGTFVLHVHEFGKVTVWNEKPMHPRGMPHPHISKNGNACFGNIGIQLVKLGAEYRFYEVIDLVLRWLTSGYTPGLAETKIEEWPRVKNKKEARHARR